MSNFVGADTTIGTIRFMKEDTVMWDRLQDIKRLPWLKKAISSFENRIAYSGELTDEQRSRVTQMYIESCVISDEDIEEQRLARLLAFKLLRVTTGKTRDFVESVILHTHSCKLSPRRIEALKNISKRYTSRLDNIYMRFDGWTEVVI